MFHHFTGQGHARGQGAIDADEFRRLLLHVGPRNILPAEEFLTRHVQGTLASQHTCLSFDDNLRCQYDVALPVMRELGLTAFWFVYTSVLQGRPERLELYRQFRTQYFTDVEAFYDAFFKRLHLLPDAGRLLAQLDRFVPGMYLAEYPFYTDNDRRFRFTRDELLGPKAYESFMDAMIVEHGVRPTELAGGLWMDEACLEQLHHEGHVIGLHSHTHPTRLARLSPAEQRQEYEQNFYLLAALLGERPRSMSHPCNSYDTHTLHILRDLGVQLGFCSNAAAPGTPLEMPRDDHANVLRDIHRAA